MSLEMDLTEIIVTIITMPIRQSVAYYTSAYWFVIVIILSWLYGLLLFLSHWRDSPQKSLKKT